MQSNAKESSYTERMGGSQRIFSVLGLLELGCTTCYQLIIAIGFVLSW